MVMLSLRDPLIAFFTLQLTFATAGTVEPASSPAMQNTMGEP